MHSLLIFLSLAYLYPPFAMATTLDTSVQNGPEFVSAINALAGAACQDTAKKWLSLAHITSVQIEPQGESQTGTTKYIFSGVVGMNVLSVKLSIVEDQTCAVGGPGNGGHGGCTSTFTASILH